MIDRFNNYGAKRFTSVSYYPADHILQSRDIISFIMTQKKRDYRTKQTRFSVSNELEWIALGRAPSVTRACITFRTDSE